MAEAFGIACHELVSLDFRCGSRLCKNAVAESFCAIIESGAWLRRFIISAKANFLIQYFDWVSKSLFLHGLGQLETFPALSRMSVAGGRPDVISTKTDIGAHAA